MDFVAGVPHGSPAFVAGVPPGAPAFDCHTAGARGRTPATQKWGLSNCAEERISP